MLLSDYTFHKHAELLIRNVNSKHSIELFLQLNHSLILKGKKNIIDFFRENSVYLEVIPAVLEYLKVDDTKFLFSLAIQAFIIIVTILKIFRCCMINIIYSLTFFIFLEIVYEFCYGSTISFYFLPIRAFLYVFSFLPLTSCWARWFYPIYAIRVTPKIVERENQFDPEMQRFVPPSVLQRLKQKEEYDTVDMK